MGSRLRKKTDTDTKATHTSVLDRADLPVDTTQLARFLIGKLVVRELAEGVAAGRIVETEAYPIGDPAGHAYRGVTRRNPALFLERGYAYVYLAYGLSFMLNVSSEAPGVGAGVLIRAIEPTDGIPIMQRTRGMEQVRDLARGPGRLCAALDIDRRLDGIDLCQAGPLWLGSDGRTSGEIGHTHWHHPRGRPVAALLRARQSVRQRPTGAQQIRGPPLPFRDGRAVSHPRAERRPKPAGTDCATPRPIAQFCSMSRRRR